MIPTLEPERLIRSDLPRPILRQRTLGSETAISLVAADNIRSLHVAERLGAVFENVTQYDGMAFGVYRHLSANSLKFSSNAIH